MGKPTKKNIRRKNRRTRRKVNKKKMKKGGNFYTQFGNCNFGETKVMSGYLTCSERFTALKVTIATRDSLSGNFKNPYDQINDVAVKMSSKNYCRSDEEGNNMLNDDGYLLTIRSCTKRDTTLIEDKIYIE